VNLALTLVAAVFGTLGFLGALWLIRMFGESVIEAHRDRKRGNDPFADDTAPDSGAR